MHLTARDQGQRTGLFWQRVAKACRTPLFLLRPMAAIVLGLAVSACVPETTTPRILPPPGASPRQAMEEFVIAVATADVVGDACGTYGIRKNYNDTDTLIRSYILELYEQGYSLQELERAVDTASVASAGQKSIRRLQAAGVRQGDLASLCRYGKAEMAKGSAIGRLLRSTK
jgi:hypothetical protein